MYPTLTWLPDMQEVTLVDTGVWLENPEVDQGDGGAVSDLPWL